MSSQGSYKVKGVRRVKEREVKVLNRAAGFEDGRQGHMPRNAVACGSWERQEKVFPEPLQNAALLRI